jgi:hypothetical protein
MGKEGNPLEEEVNKQAVTSIRNYYFITFMPITTNIELVNIIKVSNLHPNYQPVAFY